MKILITLNKTDILGGTVIWAYTVAEEFLRLEHEVYIQVWSKGRNHHRFISLGVKEHETNNHYDLILGNHLSRFQHLSADKIINICHGTIPELEQPDKRAHKHVSITDEVQRHLLEQGYESEIVYNPVNIDKFKDKGKGIGVLSLCQGKEANEMIAQACKELRVPFKAHSKYNNPVWNLWDVIPQFEVVVGVGRGIYEALCCNKKCIVMDSRDYYSSWGDGEIFDVSDLYSMLGNNFSGRTFQVDIEKNWVKACIENLLDATLYQQYSTIARSLFDSKKIVKQLLEL